MLNPFFTSDQPIKPYIQERPFILIADEVNKKGAILAPLIMLIKLFFILRCPYKQSGRPVCRNNPTRYHTRKQSSRNYR